MNNKSGFTLFQAIISLAIILAIVLLAAALYVKYQSTASAGIGNGTILVIETNSGSTNTPPETFSIYQDGSARKTYHIRSNIDIQNGYLDRSVRTGTLKLSQIELDLKELGDVSKIPTNSSCPKPISFATSTTITYNNQTSGDISCLKTQNPKVTRVVSDLYALESLVRTSK